MGIAVQRTVDSGVVCESYLQDAVDRGKNAVWVLPDYNCTLERRKQLAASRSDLRFGCTVSMLTAWIDDLWALYGDGRLVVSAVQRKILMKRVLLEAASLEEPLFEASPGTVSLLCRMVQQGLGLDAFVRAMGAGGGQLGETHRAMLRAAEKYNELLKQKNLCERAEAMRLLLDVDGLEWPTLACEGFVSLSPCEASFFANLSMRTDVLFAVGASSGSSFEVDGQLVLALRRFDAQVDRLSCDRLGSAEVRDPELARLSALLYDGATEGRLAPTGALKALLPAGRYALPEMLVEEVFRTEGDILLVCNKPAAMFEELAPRLSVRGVSVGVACMRPFGKTDFGRTLLNVYEMFKGDRFDVAQASDCVSSMISAKGPRGVYSLDAGWRARRVIDAERVKGVLNDGEGDPLGSFALLIEQGRFDEAFTLAEERYCELSYYKEYAKAEQFAAIKCARTVLDQAKCLGEDFEDALDLLYGIKVGVSAQVLVDGGAEPRVRIASYYDAAQLAEASFDAVFACDLNASEQPLKLRRTSLDGLLDALDVSVARDALFESRVRMLRVVGAAKSKLYLVRALNDENAAPLYPAVAFEEINSCYAGDTDKGTGLAGSLVEAGCSSHRGEEFLEENLAKVPCGGVEVLPAGAVAKVSAEMADALLEPVRKYSASAIELYLDCPYKWFASRRLRLTHLDAGFSALEKGSFLHEVLKAFYEAYREAFGKGKPEPAEESFASAKPLFDEVFDAAVARQASKDPCENPLVPLSQAEQRQMDELRQQLFGFIVRDASLLPGFEPWHFEYGFGKNEEVEYAGVPVVGSIDRIDVDAQGRIAIIDYKSSLGDSYHLVPSPKGEEKEQDVELPAKVQALIYAQIAKRLLGKQPVAALYVHALRPGSQPEVCGAYDDYVLGPDDIPGIKAAKSAASASGWGSFGNLLDGVEVAIREKLEELGEANISISPRDENSCSFCPVLECEGRK